MSEQHSASQTANNSESVATAADLARFVVNRATKAALEAVCSCAVDGTPEWKVFFEEGLADAISEETELETEFFARLTERGLPYTAQIIDAYLTGMRPERLKKLMDVAALKRKAHPANLAFYGATFKTPSGAYMLEVFKVFLKHGLNSDMVDIVVNRCFDDMERACALAHEPFMMTVVPMITKLPDELVQSIVSRSGQAENVIAILVNKCGIPVSTFTDPKILAVAKPQVAEYIIAIDARSRREPARVIQTLEEEL